MSGRECVEKKDLLLSNFDLLSKLLWEIKINPQASIHEVLDSLLCVKVVFEIKGDFLFTRTFFII